MTTSILYPTCGLALFLAISIAPCVMLPRAAGEEIPPAASDSSARFSGQVIGPNGKPFVRENLRRFAERPAIKLQLWRQVWRRVAETDSVGRFAFEAPDMTYTELDGLPARSPGHLIAVADGLGFAWSHLRGHRSSHRGAASGIDVTLQLPAGDTPIRGRFLDGEGRPLAGARVRLTRVMIPMGRDLDEHLAREIGASFTSSLGYDSQWNDPDLVPGLVTETHTDADGRFVLSGIGRERLASLSVSAPTVEDTDVIVMTRETPDVRTRLGDTLTPPEAPRPVIHGAGFTLQLKPGSTIRGVVSDRNTGEPIEGMWVGIGGEPTSGLATGDYPLATDCARPFHDHRPAGKAFRLQGRVSAGCRRFVSGASLSNGRGSGDRDGAA